MFVALTFCCWRSPWAFFSIYLRNNGWWKSYLRNTSSYRCATTSLPPSHGKDLPKWRLVDKVLSISEARLHFLSKKGEKCRKNMLSKRLRRTLCKQWVQIEHLKYLNQWMIKWMIWNQLMIDVSINQSTHHQHEIENSFHQRWTWQVDVMSLDHAPRCGQ